MHLYPALGLVSQRQDQLDSFREKAQSVAHTQFLTHFSSFLRLNFHSVITAILQPCSWWQDSVVGGIKYRFYHDLCASIFSWGNWFRASSLLVCKVSLQNPINRKFWCLCQILKLVSPDMFSSQANSVVSVGLYSFRTVKCLWKFSALKVWKFLDQSTWALNHSFRNLQKYKCIQNSSSFYLVPLDWWYYQ